MELISYAYDGHIDANMHCLEIATNSEKKWKAIKVQVASSGHEVESGKCSDKLSTLTQWTRNGV